MDMAFEPVTKSHRTRHHQLLFGGLAFVSVVLVFTIDTLSQVQGAIAVLYAIALMIAAEAVDRSGLFFLTIFLISLTLISYFITHGPDSDMPVLLRLAVAVAALLVTAALLLRSDRARTELINANSALRDSERRYRSIFEQTRVALWERDYSKLREYLLELKSQGLTSIKAQAHADPDFISRCIDMIGLVAANDAAVDLLRDDHGTEKANARFIPIESDSFASLLQSILDGASSFEGHGEIIAGNGQRKSVIIGISFPEDPAAYDRVVVSMVDVTQREEARKALVEAQAELSRASKVAAAGVISASLAHDLNQPLGAIGVNSQTLIRWLDRDPPDIEAAKRSAERIARDSARASDIIGHTRALLTATPKPAEPIDLGGLVDDTLAFLEHEFRREQVTVEVALKTAVPVICGIRTEMQQVLINLFSNAVQAISESDDKRRLITVSIDALNNGNEVSVSIRDTGKGLQPESQDKLFTPFFTTKTNGMGMGLSICRSVIEARGGSVLARNHPLGGALFEIILPKEAEDARPQKQEA